VTSTDDRYTQLRLDLEKAVRRVCPPWLADRAQDLVQVAVVRLLERERKERAAAAAAAASESSEPSEVAGEGIGVWSTSYLYRVAHSVLVDEIRARRRRPEMPLEAPSTTAGGTGGTGTEAAEGTAPVDRIATSAVGPEGRARGAEIGRALRECLGRLVDDRRRAVSLNLAGHSVPETARLLGFVAKRAENLVYRGLADLRSCLEEKGWKP
jgi:RNA polymerase sigma-70 factor (ECF subfamily)